MVQNLKVAEMNIKAKSLTREIEKRVDLYCLKKHLYLILVVVYSIQSY